MQPLAASPHVRVSGGQQLPGMAAVIFVRLVVHGVITGGGGAATHNPTLGTFRVRCRALQLEAVEAAAEVDGGDGSLVP